MANQLMNVSVDRKWDFWSGWYYHIATCLVCTWKSEKYHAREDAVAAYSQHPCPGRKKRWRINHGSKIIPEQTYKVNRNA